MHFGGLCYGSHDAFLQLGCRFGNWTKWKLSSILGIESLNHLRQNHMNLLINIWSFSFESEVELPNNSQLQHTKEKRKQTEMDISYTSWALRLYKQVLKYLEDWDQWCGTGKIVPLGAGCHQAGYIWSLPWKRRLGRLVDVFGGFFSWNVSWRIFFLSKVSENLVVFSKMEHHW